MDEATQSAEWTAEDEQALAEFGKIGDDVTNDDAPAEPEQTELPLELPGSAKPSTPFKGVKEITVEGKLRGSSVRQLGGVVTNPDQLIELRVLARLYDERKVPRRDATGAEGVTRSAVIRQTFEPLQIEVVTPSE